MVILKKKSGQYVLLSPKHLTNQLPAISQYHPVPSSHQPLPSCTTPVSDQMGINLVSSGIDLRDPWYCGMVVHTGPCHHIPGPGITDVPWCLELRQSHTPSRHQFRL